MAQRIYYLRDRTNITKRPNGEYTRGNPRVCIITECDLVNGKVRYAIAALHPKDHFDKRIARELAEDRLQDDVQDEWQEIIEKQKKRAEKHKEENKKRSKSFIPPFGKFDTDAKTGHTINKAVIEHLAKSFDTSNTQVKQLANQWLDRMSQPKVEVVKEKEYVISNSG